MALARKPFVVIDAEILSSSVWSESAHVKLVWLTLLILCDTEGYVGAAIPGIARAAGVTVDQTREALSLFMRPDPDSRTRAHEGRRLEPADRGFRILNFREHLDRLSADRRKARDRVRKFRERKRQSADGNVTILPGNRDQGVGNRDKQEGMEEPASLPADVQGERLLHESRVAKERRFYALISRLAELQPEKDPPDIAREITGYKAKDGRSVKGVVRPEGLTEERLDRSLEDAKWWIEDLEKRKGAEHGAS
jgi:hypothetical protein